MNFVSSLTEMSIFRVLNLVQLQLRSASESIQPVLIIWAGLNSNQVRLMKSSASEPGLNFPSLVRLMKKSTFGLGHSVLLCLGTLRSNDADDNENVKKTIGLISKTSTSHMHHTFLYISLPVSARLRRENA